MSASAGPADGAPPGKAPVALYVHVPFCLSICPYCDFVVYTGRAARGEGSRVDDVLRAMGVEIGLRAEVARRTFGSLRPLRSVYVGGGTPSLLSAQQLNGLLEAVSAGFGLEEGAEVTLEANPGPADQGDLRGFRAAGANRLSIGAQSMDAAQLRALGRRHAPADVVATVRQARAAGFDNISVDLLYDIPAQTLTSWRQTLQATLALEPEHISAYALALDDPDADNLTGPDGDHLPLRSGMRRWRTRARAAQDEDLAAACYEEADAVLSRAGLEWYELSNWSRPGHESRHNLAYWRHLAYEAVGPGAHAFDGALSRRWNAARLDAYLAALLPADGERAKLPPAGTDALDRQTASAEQAILSLRLKAGLTAAKARLPAFAAALAWAWSAGLLEEAEGGGVRLSMRGRLLASELFWRLLPDQERHAA